MIPPSDRGYSSTPNPVALLEMTAIQQKKKFFLFALFDKEHSDELLVELTQLACEDNWVVIEHCHLYSDWQEVLQQIIQVCHERIIYTKFIHVCCFP